MTGPGKHIRIVGIAGSLRQASFNAALLRAAAGLLPQGASLAVATLEGIPLYDGDLESTEGIPPAAARLKDAVADADALLLATPEYNNSMPGVMKNAIDWMSRPPDDIARVFHDRPVAVMGATPGGMGTAHAQTAWLPVLRTLGTRPWFGGRYHVSRAGNLFDDSMVLVDGRSREALAEFLRGFVRFVRSQRAKDA